jgi:hypothetical protein
MTSVVVPREVTGREKPRHLLSPPRDWLSAKTAEATQGYGAVVPKLVSSQVETRAPSRSLPYLERGPRIAQPWLYALCAR